LDVPEGMGVILRTAGAARTRQEVKRDFEYLLRLWEQVRDLTLNSTAPTLVYEEGSLAKRSIRDLYSKDIEEIIVAGEQGYRDAKEFMRMLMPSHAKNVKLYADTQQPIFTRYGIESQLDAMFSPTVQLKSGGYIVINQTEALVSIDVNSGRSTREHHIEDTAVKTNCEAAEEVARQLRLRDLAGLIVIDFIDMDEKRNNRTVERRMKDALRNDRARIQVGRISHFGLLEMSRQRIRTSVLESSTDKCPYCGGTGHMRSVSSVALQLLRAIEETLLKGATHNQIVRTRPEIAQYVLNNKRAHLMALEQRFRISIAVNADATVTGQPGFMIERGEQVMTPEQAKAIAAQAQASAPPQIVEEEEPDFIAEEVEDEEENVEERGNIVEHDDAESQDDEQHADRQPSDELGDDGQPRDGQRRRRRRRRGRGGGERQPQGEQQPFAAARDDAPAGENAAGFEPTAMSEDGEPAGFAPQPHGDANGNGEQRHRRRGRRGGRRNRRGRDGAPAGNGGGEQFRSDFHRDDAGQEMSSQPFAQPSDEHSEPQPQPSYEPPREPSFAPPAPPPPAPEPEQEQPAAPEPRRRSTVREPAPVFSGDSVIPPAPPPPMPEPVPVVTSASDDANKPRRTGWWAKRLLGGDKT
jgi:ribonuclease E